MKVKLILDVAPFSVFPLMSELEIEVANGTYLAQSQVKIMGASADTQNQGRTVVDINLVPLGEKFDNTTASLTYERFWHKKIPLNKSLFGDYTVLYISYPGRYFVFLNNILPIHTIAMLLVKTEAVAYQGYHHHHHMKVSWEVVQVEVVVVFQSLLNLLTGIRN